MEKLFFKNIGINTFNTIYTQGMQVLLLLIMTRWLTPSDFGVFALVSIVLNFSVLISEFGTGSYIIYIKKSTNEILSTSFILNVFMCFSISFIIYYYSDLLSLNFEVSDPYVFKLACISILFSGIGVIHKATLEKDLLFEKISTIEISATTVSTIISIVVAMNNGGVYALVLQSVIRSALCSSGYVIFSSCSFGKLSFFSFNELKKISKYSLYLMLNNIVNQVSRSADQMIIGKKLSLDSLGYYSLAYRFILFPVQRVNAIINRVNFPTLARIKDDNEFEKHFCNSTIMTCFITFPILTYMFFCSNQIINVFFDHSWSVISSLIPILVPVGVIQTILSNVSSLYLVKNKTKIGFIIQCISTLLTVSAFFIGVQYGIEGVLICYLIANVIIFIPAFYIPLKFSKISMLKILKRVIILLIFNIALFYFFYNIINTFSFSNNYIFVVVSLLYVLFVYLLMFRFKKLVLL